MTRRLFLALPAPPIPQDLERRIDAAIAPLPGARRTLMEARHITLAFLGDVEEEAIPSVRQAMREAAQAAAPVPYALDRLGGFPGRTARILALTGRTPKALAALALDLSRRLRERGIAVDEKLFRLHLTLARLRSPQNLPQEAIAEVRAAAEEIHLYESELLSAGAHYTIMETSPLSAALPPRQGPDSGEGGD